MKFPKSIGQEDSQVTASQVQELAQFVSLALGHLGEAVKVQFANLTEAFESFDPKALLEASRLDLKIGPIEDDLATCFATVLEQGAELPGGSLRFFFAANDSRRTLVEARKLIDSLSIQILNIPQLRHEFNEAHTLLLAMMIQLRNFWPSFSPIADNADTKRGTSSTPWASEPVTHLRLKASRMAIMALRSDRVDAALALETVLIATKLETIAAILVEVAAADFDLGSYHAGTPSFSEDEPLLASPGS